MSLKKKILKTGASYIADLVKASTYNTEKIIVSCQEGDPKHYKYNFIEPAIVRLFEYYSFAKVTWIIFNAGYTKEDFIKFRYIGSRYRASIIKINSVYAFQNYINSMDVSLDSLSQKRKKQPISRLTIYAHGDPDNIWIDYKTKVNEELGFNHIRIEKLSPEAFKNAEIFLCACNTATGKDEMKKMPDEERVTMKHGSGSIGEKFAMHTKSKVYGFWGKSDYTGICKFNFSVSGLWQLSQKVYKKWLKIDKNIGINSEGKIELNEEGALSSIPEPGFFGTGLTYPTNDSNEKIPAKIITFNYLENKLLYSISEGMEGEKVQEIQIRIAGWASDTLDQKYIKIDGKFGPKTELAVKRFQKAYGLDQTGIVDSITQNKLNSLEKSNKSTINFNFNEFYSKDGALFSSGKVSKDVVKEQIRRLMWKLEALRKKSGDNPITINSGFRSISYNSSIPGATSNSQHMYGIAADIVISGKNPSEAAESAKKCGFSGIKKYSTWIHVDSRLEYPYGAQYWWWP